MSGPRAVLRKAVCSVTVLAFLTAGAGCGDWRSDPDGFTERDLAMLRTMALIAMPRDPGNEFQSNPLVQRLGQNLFFDLSMAERKPEGKDVSCASCHSPNQWFSDPRRTSLSVGVGVPTSRNSPSLVNVGFYNWWGWDGRADSIWGQARTAFESPRTMNGNATVAYRRVRQTYPQLFNSAFVNGLADGGSVTIEALTPDEAYPFILKSWGAYIASLASSRAPFDLWASGEDPDALDQQQKRGLKLFIGKAGCIQCHRGPTFTDNQFHSVGIGQIGDGLPAADDGRFEGLAVLWRAADAGFALSAPQESPEPKHRGQFRTKSLRHVAMTGPYFHGGQLKTLKDVVWFYNQGGDHAGAGTTSPFLVPLGLTDEEQADVVAFLESLTGAPISAAQQCDPSNGWRSTEEPGFVLPDGGLVLDDGGVVNVREGGTVLYDGGATLLKLEPVTREFKVCP